ncbi:hypothetical protein D3C85_718820 [compost metagenome]
MVVAEGQVHHRADLDLAVDGHRALHDVVHAQDARLRRVQDRRRHQRAVGAAVGDGEGAALHLIHGQGAVTGGLAQGADALFDARQRQGVGVAQDRNHQTLVGADGHADVVVVLVDDVRAVDLGVDGGQLAQGLNHGLGEEGHEAQLHAVALLEDFLVLGAQGHDVGHVHLVEGGQLGGRVLGFLQATGDGLTQARHLHPLFARLVGARGDRRSSLGRSRSGGADGGDGVSLGDVALRTRGRQRRRIQVVFRNHALNGRRQVSRSRRLSRAGVGRSSGGRRSRRGRSGARGRNRTDDLTGGHGRAVVGDDGQDAGGRGRDFHRDLVGLDLDQQFVLGDGVARLLQPGADRTLGDAFAHGRDGDLDRGAARSGRCGGGGGRSSGGRSRRGGRGRSAFAHRTQHRAGNDGVAFSGVDRRQDAVGRSHDFQRNLVGFQLDQDFVLTDGVADLLGPLGDGGFADGFTEGGGEDIGHGSVQCLFVSWRIYRSGRAGQAMASARKVSSSFRWRLIRPAAVEAEAGRPT